MTGGEAADCNQAIPLLENKDYEALLADKGYDYNVIIDHVERVGATLEATSESVQKWARSLFSQYSCAWHLISLKVNGKLDHITELDLIPIVIEKFILHSKNTPPFIPFSITPVFEQGLLRRKQNWGIFLL